MTVKPLTREEWQELGSATLHGPLPKEMQMRLFATVDAHFQEPTKELTTAKPTLHRLMVDERGQEVVAMWPHDYKGLVNNYLEFRKRLLDFLDYFDPKGGISDVPLGPFERAQEALVLSMGSQLKTPSQREYNDVCPDCCGELEGMVGSTFDSMPASYPVQCTKCDWTGHAERTDERKAYDQAQDRQ